MSIEMGLTVNLNVDYEQAIQLVTEALKEEGFGVLTEIDVKATLKEKLGVDFKRYVILGACNPPLAYSALQIQEDVGLLLPCNAIVYETGPQQATVTLVDPGAMLAVTGNAALQEPGDAASARLRRVQQKLAAM